MRHPWIHIAPGLVQKLDTGGIWLCWGVEAWGGEQKGEVLPPTLSLWGLLEILKGKCRKWKCGIAPYLSEVQTALPHPGYGDADSSSLGSLASPVAVLKHRLRVWTLELDPCCSKCGPGTRSWAYPGSVLGMQHPGPHPRPPESEPAY